jgi:small-conductance mechanosensitive channel
VQPAPPPEPTPVPSGPVEPPSDPNVVWHEVIRNRLEDMGTGFLKVLPNLILGFIALVIFALLARFAQRLASKIARKSRLRRSLVDLIAQLVYTAMWILGILVAMTIVFPSVKPGSLLAGLGITGIVLGFAFKDIVENFIAGVLILWRFPIEIGDWIEVNDIEGRVERINIRMTELRQVDGDLVIMPNATLFTNPVINWTNLEDRRTTIIVGVAYDEDVGESRQVIQEAVKACETVRRSAARPVQIFAQEFASSSINFEVTWWTGSTPVEIRKSRDEVVQAVKEALDTAGIEIPFPYRTLTFKEPLPISRTGSDVE